MKSIPFASVLLIAAYSARGADAGSLGWMTGCWAMQAGPMVIEEQWNKPVGGQMMGLSRTIKQGKVVFSEFMRIDTKGQEISYLPRIGTKAVPVAFLLTSQSETEVIFENPAHDFPQRILYRKTADGLHARIDGVEKGKQRAEEFPMKQVACR